MFWRVALPMTQPALIVVVHLRAQGGVDRPDAAADLPARPSTRSPLPLGLKAMIDTVRLRGREAMGAARAGEGDHDRSHDHRVLPRPAPFHRGDRDDRDQGLTFGRLDELRRRDRVGMPPELPRGRSSSGQRRQTPPRRAPSRPRGRSRHPAPAAVTAAQLGPSGRGPARLAEERRPRPDPPGVVRAPDRRVGLAEDGGGSAEQVVVGVVAGRPEYASAIRRSRRRSTRCRRRSACTAPS